jgi:hypothetical protein
MALDALTLRRVRDKTTSDLTLLPDSKIEDFVLDNTYAELGVDLNGTLADAWEYLARDEWYMSQSIGAVSVSQPIALRRAAYYRSKAVGGNAAATIGYMTRGDLWTTITEVEHGIA